MSVSCVETVGHVLLWGFHNLNSDTGYVSLSRTAVHIAFHGKYRGNPVKTAIILRCDLQVVPSFTVLKTIISTTDNESQFVIFH